MYVHHNNCSAEMNWYLLMVNRQVYRSSSVYVYRRYNSDKLLQSIPLYGYTLNKNTLKTLIKLLDWSETTHNCPVMGSVQGYHFFYLPIQDPYIKHILQAAHNQQCGSTFLFQRMNMNEVLVHKYINIHVFKSYLETSKICFYIRISVRTRIPASCSALQLHASDTNFRVPFPDVPHIKQIDMAN